jgi:hypothetical protein
VEKKSKFPHTSQAEPEHKIPSLKARWDFRSGESAFRRYICRMAYTGSIYTTARSSPTHKVEGRFEGREGGVVEAKPWQNDSGSDSNHCHSLKCGEYAYQNISAMLITCAETIMLDYVAAFCV